MRFSSSYRQSQGDAGPGSGSSCRAEPGASPARGSRPPGSSRRRYLQPQQKKVSLFLWRCATNQSGRQALTVGQQCRMLRDQAHVPLHRFLPRLRRPVVHVIPRGRRARRETEGRHVVEDLDAELVAAVQVRELRAGVEAREGILQTNARPAFNERRCGGGLEVLTGMIMLMPCEQRIS